MPKNQSRLGSDVYFSCLVVFLSKVSEEFKNHRYNEFLKIKIDDAMTSFRRHDIYDQNATSI